MGIRRVTLREEMHELHTTQLYRFNNLLNMFQSLNLLYQFNQPNLFCFIQLLLFIFGFLSISLKMHVLLIN